MMQQKSKNMSQNSKTFSKKNFIAEIGVNFENNLDIAKSLISECSELGVGAVKFQTYKADKLAAKFSPSYWDIKKEKTTSQHELFSKYDSLVEKDWIDLASYCESKNIEFMSTPFDLESVDMLDPMVKRYKISSSDITNVPLLRKIAQKKKPIILSTGASNLEEIKFAVNEISSYGCKFTLLHCVLNYPCDFKNSSLSKIKTLKNEFPHAEIGYSDHVAPIPGNIQLFSSILFGAKIIEKHYTHDRSLPGNDHYHAFDYQTLDEFFSQLDEFNSACDVKDLSMQDSARTNARRGIYADQDIKSGTVLTEKHLICKRPVHDFIPASEWDNVVGKKTKNDINKDIGITINDIE